MSRRNRFDRNMHPNKTERFKKNNSFGIFLLNLKIKKTKHAINQIDDANRLLKKVMKKGKSCQSQARINIDKNVLVLKELLIELKKHKTELKLVNNTEYHLFLQKKELLKAYDETTPTFKKSPFKYGDINHEVMHSDNPFLNSELLETIAING